MFQVKIGCAFALASALCAPVAHAAEADGVAEFYKGKNVSLLVGFPSGNGADSYGRLISRHIGRFLPGAPPVVVQNCPAPAA